MFRFSLRTLLVVFALIGIALVFSSQWRCVLRRANMGTGSTRYLNLREDDVIEFFEMRGFERYTGHPQSLFANDLIPLPETKAVCMRADICGYGEMFVFFWLDQPHRHKEKLANEEDGINIYCDAPWFMGSQCRQRVNELSETYHEFILARGYATLNSQSPEETRLCLLEGYFRGMKDISSNSPNLDVRKRVEADRQKKSPS